MPAMQVLTSSMEHSNIQRWKPESRQSLRLKIYVDKKALRGERLKIIQIMATHKRY